MFALCGVLFGGGNFASAADVLKPGDRGDEVRYIQELLIEYGYLNGTADGAYGDDTFLAVKKFQKDVGLKVDGFCGQATRWELENVSVTPDDGMPSATVGGLLKPNMRGVGVRYMQKMLIERGYLEGNADGVFGANTKSALESFQRDHGLKADGVCGNATYTAFSAADGSPDATYAPIGSVIKTGMSGEGVTAVQKMLIAQGYLDGDADGKCGSKTTAAIKRFQRDKGLKADGVCGNATYAALNGSDAGEAAAVEDGDFVGRGNAVRVRATAYSPHEQGGRRTASGTKVRRGIIAVDPNFIPLGTRVFIPGYGHAVAEDIGGSIKGNRIDIAFDTYEEAMAFGRQDVKIYIVE